jgi:hypothetical protein
MNIQTSEDSGAATTNKQSESSGGRPPHKKQKTEEMIKVEAGAPATKESELVLLLEWCTCEDGTEKEHSISADEIISQGISFGETSAVVEQEKLENEERGYTLKLVDKKQDNKVVAELNFDWWEDSSHANLMNFNQKSK